MMTDVYIIESTRRFDRDFDSFDEEMQKRFMESLNVLKETPYIGKRLHGKLKGFYSLRIGDYRVIYSLSEQRKTVTLYFICHRKKIYDV